MDEDALLGIGSDDEFPDSTAATTQKPSVAGGEQNAALFVSSATDAVDEDEMIQLGVDEADDLDE